MKILSLNHNSILLLKENALVFFQKKKKSICKMEFAIKAFLKMALCTQPPLYSLIEESIALWPKMAAHQVSALSLCPGTAC